MRKEKISKDEAKLAITIVLQNIVMTALFVILAIVFKKWWISLLSFLTWQNVTYKITKKEKEDDKSE